MYDDWDEDHELMMVGGIGTITSVLPPVKKKKKPLMKRPIGFITNLDELEPIDD